MVSLLSSDVLEDRFFMPDASLSSEQIIGQRSAGVEPQLSAATTTATATLGNFRIASPHLMKNAGWKRSTWIGRNGDEMKKRSGLAWQ